MDWVDIFEMIFESAPMHRQLSMRTVCTKLRDARTTYSHASFAACRRAMRGWWAVVRARRQRVQRICKRHNSWHRRLHREDDEVRPALIA